MAMQFSTGSVHCFLRPPGGAITYFGTCESMPQDSRSREYEMLMNDMSGSKVPLDVAFEGESAQIGLVMTRIYQPLSEILMNAPSSIAANVALNNLAAGGGGYGLFDVGALMAIEGLTWQVYLVNSFGGALGNKPVYVNNGLRPGRRYLQCILWAPQSDEAGTKPMKQHFMFYAWPAYVPAARRFLLYDYIMTGININAIV